MSRSFFRLLKALCLPLCFFSLTAFAAPLLLRNPSISRDKVAFVYAGDIWTAPRDGGEAQRLTSEGTITSGPYFSPDGGRVLYSSKSSGSDEVYLIDASGGIPKRITWNSMGNYAAGWTPDGKEVLFASFRTSYSDFFRLFTAHADGSGIPEPLPLPSAVTGAYSEDGKSIAYVPILQWEAAWKRYRGGQTTPIWLVDLKTLDLEKIPRDNSNDSDPVWVGNTVYFLSDRNGPVTLFAYDTKTKAVTQVVENHTYDLKSVSAGPGALVYEQFGSLHLYDLSSHQDKTINITINGDLPNLRPHLATIPPQEIRNANISPTGARAVFEAHGDIFTVPAEKGDTRNLTRTPATAERDPYWSPDGKSVAYFSDASGEYKLFIRDQNGLGNPKVIDLGPDPSYFYSPKWSPDSKHIAYADKHLRLWYVDVDGEAGGKPIKIDTGLRGGFDSGYSNVSWSPDSKWIAYSRDLENQLHAIFFYSLDTHKATQITDGMSDALHPVFDPGGKYVYFTASTDNGPSSAGIDLSSLDRATTSSPYVIVLKRYGTSPVPPESDDEKGKDEKKDDDKKSDDDKKKDDTKPAANSKKDDSKPADADAKKDDKKDAKDEKPVEVVIDLEAIGNRILSLPVPARNYLDLQVGKTGVIYLAEGPPVGRSSNEGGGPGIRSLWRFTTEKRETDELLRNLDAFVVSANGEKILTGKGDNWFIASTADLKPGSPDAPAGKPLNMGSMQAVIDPRPEWKQMYHETWRIERDFLYDPKTHGLSIPKIEAKYQPFLDGLASREEFTYLCEEMLGEISIGHMFISGPNTPDKSPKVGLLGADYTTANDRYKFAKIYNGQNWTPSLTAPLTLPGINIRQGEYLFAVNGRELHANDNLYSFFDGTAGKQTVLHVGWKPDESDAHDVTVVPVDSEHGLRNLDWINENRIKVDKLSDGKIAYVYMPNTGGAGYTNFNRYFYAQIDRQGLVLDERYNEGGFIADYVVNVLSQQPLSGAIERDGKPVHDPVGAIFGPKAMIINQSAGSGGDAMPWYFRKARLGTLVGTRTWGGLVGIGGYPSLLDGGSVTAPRYAIYGLHGEFEVEGHGIPPDIEVQEYPKDTAAGHDLQLEKAVQEVLDQLKEKPVPEIPIPPYPNYHQNDGLGVK
jgi:tricorn protease